MPQAFYILFGALFTVAVATALGKLLLRRLGVGLYRQEEGLLAFLCGAPLLSLVVFAACATGVARKGVFLWVGIAILALAFWTGAHRPRGASLPPLGRFWKWLFGIVWGVYAVLYFFNAMAPELSPDGSSYHLGNIYRYLLHHRFYRIDSMYANLSQGVEMLFMYAFAFGKHSAAALVHCSFLLALPWLMLCWGRRFGMGAAGACGGLLFFAAPVVGIDGSSAYIDVAVAAIAFALFYLLQIWDAERHRGLLVPIGLLAGYAFAAKYTAFLAVPYAVAFVAWKCRRKGQGWLRPAAVVAVCAAVVILPWMAKNWVLVQNPLSPFFNAVFPNPYVSVGFERDYTAQFRMYTIQGYRELPMALTVHGQLAGIVGPVYLLAPLALLSLAWPAGRQLLLAAAVFGVTYFGNIGTRFLIFPLPFLALAMALVLLRVRYLAPAAVLVHAVLSWPAVMPRYTGETNWRLTGIPWRAALRIVPEDQFLGENHFTYRITRIIDRLVPPNSRVLTFSSAATSYTSRDVQVFYESSLGKAMGNIQLTPLLPEMSAKLIHEFRFPAQALRKVRVVQTALGKPDYWSVSELRVYQGGQELPRAASWRLRAQPNPWHVQFAFDNSLVTRWSSMQTIYPGMFVEVDFGKPETVDRVTLACTTDQYKIRLKLEGEDGAGNWKALAAAPTEHEGPPLINLRRAAAEELKHHGFGYLLIFDSDYRSEDYRTNADKWGIELIGESPGIRLYRIL